MTAEKGPSVTVFVENEAGSSIKHHHDEQALRLLFTEQVARPYPFAYGFVPGTTGPDGDCVDCFVITDRVLGTGDQIECTVVAFMEQVEAGERDHNLIAVPIGEPVPDLEAVYGELREFVAHFRDHDPTRTSVPGRLLGIDAAVRYLTECAG
jgi:inorganic pyrophosphatase